MKNELHARLWGAQQRWFALREQGETKHALKMRGIREHGDPNRYTRNLIFAGSTRLTYERILKGVVEYAHREHGCHQLEDIGKREYRAFLDRAIEQGRTAKTLNLYRSALAKLGALTGRTESAAALSKRYGERIRKLVRAGTLRGPARPHVSPEVRQAVLERLARLDALAEARSGQPRGYALALELQKEASLRSIEATDRFSARSLLGIDGDKGRIEIIGKGGRLRTALITGQRFDPESGLLYLKMRYTSAALGRFLSRDLFDQGYEYVLGNAVNLIDPWGLKGIHCILVLGSKTRADTKLLRESAKKLKDVYEGDLKEPASIAQIPGEEGGFPAGVKKRWDIDAESQKTEKCCDTIDIIGHGSAIGISWPGPGGVPYDLGPNVPDKDKKDEYEKLKKWLKDQLCPECHDIPIRINTCASGKTCADMASTLRIRVLGYTGDVDFGDILKLDDADNKDQGKVAPKSPRGREGHGPPQVYPPDGGKPVDAPRGGTVPPYHPGGSK